MKSIKKYLYPFLSKQIATKKSKIAKKKSKKRRKILKKKKSYYSKGGNITVGEYVMKFILENESLFDLDRLTQDHSIDMDCLQKYIAYQSGNEKTKTFWDFFYYLYQHIQYISNETITKQYDSNIDELYDLYTYGIIGVLEVSLILILPRNTDKSNFYFTLYFLYRYQKKYGDACKDIQIITEYDFVYHSDILNIDFKKKHTVFIFTDDFSYSGTQMSQSVKVPYDMNLYPHLKEPTGQYRENFSIYLNVVGMTQIAHLLFESIKEVNIMIPEQCFIPKDETFRDILTKYCRINDVTISSIDVLYFSHKNKSIKSFLEKFIVSIDLSLIYLSFKYPDNISSIPFICYLAQIPELYFVTRADIDKKIVFDTLKTYFNENETTFNEKCNSVDWIFKFKDMELFQQENPQLVHTIVTNKKQESNVYLLKLVKNCNYSELKEDSIQEIKQTPCNIFCYKPFYKNKGYKQIIQSLTFFLLSRHKREIEELS